MDIYKQNVYHYKDEELTEYLSENKFDIVGIGACGGYYQYKKLKKIAEAIDNVKEKPLFFLGGHLPSPEPEYFLRKYKANFVVIGEGEETTKDLLNTIEKNGDLNKVLGISYIDSNGTYKENERRPVIEDVDGISYPAYDLFDMEHYVLYRYPNCDRTDRVGEMISGRGCPFNCNFCYRIDKGYRPRSTKSIIEEIKFLKEKYAVTYIQFNDELLMSSVERTKDICNQFLENDLNTKWTCNGRLNYAYVDKDMLYLMKRAGCVFINYGVESIDNQAMKNMNKALTVDMIVKGVENTLEVGISPGLNIIFGNIGETEQSLKNDVEFLLKYDDRCQNRTIRPVTPYPGSPVYYYAVEKGYIKKCRRFYENKHTNSDLMTCNFTTLSDEEYYENLHWANKILLENHLEAVRKKIKRL